VTDPAAVEPEATVPEVPAVPEGTDATAPVAGGGVAAP